MRVTPSIWTVLTYEKVNEHWNEKRKKVHVGIHEPNMIALDSSGFIAKPLKQHQDALKRGTLHVLLCWNDRWVTGQHQTHYYHLSKVSKRKQHALCDWKIIISIHREAFVFEQYHCLVTRICKFSGQYRTLCFTAL